MSEHINNASKRKEALKEVLRRLQSGESVEAVKERFGEVIKGATAGEIAEAERALISEGVSVSEIQNLCDLHVAVFRESLDKEPAPETLPGHPVFTFRMENEVAIRLLEAMEETLSAWRKGDQQALNTLRQEAKNLGAIEKHYSRKENILFPYLENKGLEGPATVMWGVDNEIRLKIKQFTQYIAESNQTIDVKETALQLQAMAQDIREMVYKEENILFPEALKRLTQQEWAEIREQEEEIGFFDVTRRNTWQPDKSQNNITTEVTKDENFQSTLDGLIALDSGALTHEQINLMLTHLPVDVTFVDEHDQVRYFSQGKERIFDRSPAIIGRAVSKCHPPQSVHKVEIILVSIQGKGMSLNSGFRLVISSFTSDILPFEIRKVNIKVASKSHKM